MNNPVQMSETNAARGYEKSINDFGGKFAPYTRSPGMSPDRPVIGYGISLPANFMTKSMCFILREVRSSVFYIFTNLITCLSLSVTNTQ